MVLKLSILILAFSSIGLLSTQLIPLFLEKFQRPLEKKVGESEKQLDTMFVHIEKNKLLLMHILPPLLLGAFGLIFFQSLIFLFIGIGIGFALPTLIIKRLQAQRKIWFQAQLIDGVQLLSSSLKAGLSLIQAIEVLVEELPPPISQEFGLVLRENKMGITLDESLKRLNERMHIEELGLLVNSILVAKETGGDLTKVFSRLSTTIRDNRKLKENIKTLTMQGRMQGAIMSVLPFVFIVGVLGMNRNHFDILLNSEQGRMLLIIAVVLQAVGMILIRKFSTINV
jgi:tight adherence protein B